MNLETEICAADKQSSLFQMKRINSKSCKDPALLEGGTPSAPISYSCTLPLPSVTEQIDFGVLKRGQKHMTVVIHVVMWKDQCHDISDLVILQGHYFLQNFLTLK